MKIVEVRTYPLLARLEQPFVFSQGVVRKRSATLVEVMTDEGLVGWGEAFNQGLEPPQISAATIEHALKPLVMGANPVDTEVLWHRMYQATRDFGRKGSVMAAISAIDIALWDIAGQAHGVPVYQLLGGAFRSRVQAYATGFYRLAGAGEAGRLAEEAIAHAEGGFAAMKVKLGFGLVDDLTVMRAVARAVEGRGVTLMVDTNHAYALADAVRLGRALEAFDLRWYEEPALPEDYAGCRELRSRVNIPIAAGENEHSPYGFRELIGGGCVDIAQPDIGSAGGFTACRHIAALAQAHGVAVNPHVWGTAIAQAASLQLMAALPPVDSGVIRSEPLLEYDRSSHPMRETLVKEPIAQVRGWVEIGNRPGLGIEVDRKVVERFLV
jgi:D-galactarolactone cycloisomerase